MLPLIYVSTPAFSRSWSRLLLSTHPSSLIVQRSYFYFCHLPVGRVRLALVRVPLASTVRLALQHTHKVSVRRREK